MKTKKITTKLLVWALTLAMVMSMCSIFVGAAEPDFKISATPAEVKAGDTVTVTVSCVKDIGFQNADLCVHYDGDAFEYVSNGSGDAYSDFELYAFQNRNDMTYMCMPNDNADIDCFAWGFIAEKKNASSQFDPGLRNGGALFTVTFTAKEDIKAGSYNFDLSFRKDDKTAKSASLSISGGSKNVTAGAAATVKVAAKTVAVTGVSLDKTALTLTEGDSATLAATVAPADATNKAVTWSTSDDKVATVKDGKVTAVKAGKATITVKTEDGNKTATCAVTVEAKPEIKPESISLPATEELTIGGKHTLIATIVPANAAGTITWKSSDEKVAKVSASGEVSAIGIGTAEITASIGEVVSNKCVVTVKGIDLKGIAIDPKEATINVGGTKKLNVVYDPANTTDDKTVTWTSDNEAVAKVANDGTVTAVAEGTATITAKCGGFTATSKITVTKIAVTGIKLDKTTVTVAEGKTATLKATIVPDDAANKAVKWSSSDETIATVDENGVVTAVKKGTAKITAESVDGGFKAECTVSVLTQEEYDDITPPTSDPAVYAIAFVIALLSVAAMAVLVISKKRQSVR